MKHENENSSAYRPPEGTPAPAAPAAPVDDTIRCPVCKTALVTDPVSMRISSGQPSINIAVVIRCVQLKCNKAPRKVMLSAEGKKNGVTEDMIFNLAKQQGGCLLFTKQELISGRMAGYPAAPAAMQENPDRNIEPKERKLF